MTITLTSQVITKGSERKALFPTTTGSNFNSSQRFSIPFRLLFFSFLFFFINFILLFPWFWFIDWPDLPVPPFLGFDANASILAIADLRGCRLNPSSWNQDLALHQSSISSSTFSISPQITGGDGAIFFILFIFFSNHLQISLRWCTIFRIQLLQAQQHHHQLDKIRRIGGGGNACMIPTHEGEVCWKRICGHPLGCS